MRSAVLALLVVSKAVVAFNNKPLHHSRVLPARGSSVVLMASPPPVLEKGANSTVSIKIKVSADDTLMWFEKAAKDFAKGVEIKGFRKGAKIPTQVVVAQIGADAVKSKAISDLSDLALNMVKQQVPLVGQTELEGGEDAVIDKYNPGHDLEFAIKSDIWPELTWVGSVSDIPPLTVKQEPVDAQKVEAALKKLQERYLTAVPQQSDYEASMGDLVKGSMEGFSVKPDGTKGEPLPAVASGDDIDIVLEEGKFMPGLVEGLIGAKAGETKEVHVSFPNQVTKSLGPELAGKAALFEIQVDHVATRQLPNLDDAFAESIRPGLTYQALYDEVRAAVGEEGDKRNTNARNSAIEAELVNLVTCEVPDTLIVDQAKEKFAQLMTQQRESGMSDEELKKLITKESFEKYKNVASKNIIKTFTASLIVEDLARKEGLVANQVTVEDQMQLMKAQAEQAGSEFNAEETKASLDATLKREAVMDWLAEQLTIEYVEEEVAEEGK